MILTKAKIKDEYNLESTFEQEFKKHYTRGLVAGMRVACTLILDTYKNSKTPKKDIIDFCNKTLEIKNEGDASHG